MNLRIISIMLATIFSIPFMGGCGEPTRTPLYLDAGFKPVKGQQLMMLHCVDARYNKTSEKLNDGELDKLVRNERSSLEKRGYKVVLDNRPASTMPPAELIADMNDDQIATLAPKDAELGFLFVLDDLVVNYTVMTKTAKAESHAYIIDTRTGKVVWKDHANAGSAAGGLISGLVAMRNEVLQRCLWGMSISIPKCPK
jgi:hypothetical protein